MKLILIFLLFVTVVYARSPRRPQYPLRIKDKKLTYKWAPLIPHKIPKRVSVLDNRVEELERKVEEEDQKILTVFKNEKQFHRNLAKALKSAVLNGDKASVGYILDLGADIDTKFKGSDLNGRTALHIASEKGYISVVKELLKRGASINIVDKYGSSPLHYAAYNGQIGTAKALLDYGADIKLKNQAETTALQDAINRSHERVAEEIRSHYPETIPEEGDAELEYFVDATKKIQKPHIRKVLKIRPIPFHHMPLFPRIKHRRIGLLNRKF